MSLLSAGEGASLAAREVIARAGQVKSVKVRGRMLFSSFVSRIAPPSETEKSGGSTTADTVRLDSRAPFGRQMIVAVVVAFFGTSARTVSLIQTPAAL